jgi:hypothetical protein
MVVECIVVMAGGFEAEQDFHSLGERKIGVGMGARVRMRS